MSTRQPDLASLIADASALAPVPAAAAAAYDRHKNALIEQVDKTLAADPAAIDLIGSNPLRVMFDNHRNHADLMGNIFKLSDYGLLTTTVVWVYRAYTSHGFSSGYFPLALREWARAVRTHLSAEEARPIIAVYEWLIARHERFLALSSAVPEQAPPVAPRWRSARESFLASMLVGDHHHCQSVAAREVGSVDDLRDLYLQVIQPGMHEIGEMWQRGEISTADEHMASAIVSRVMASQYPRFVELEHTKGRVVLSSAPNEFHEIGGRMVADLLEVDGWDVTFLGANTPDNDLVDLVKRVRPHILGLSVAMPFNIDRAMETIASVRCDAEIADTYILVGGRVFVREPRLQAQIGADAWARDVQEGVVLAHTWWKERAD